ncbi:MAG: FKBP-type peptidyl-prolyl cis-trans isomerase [Hyphomonadaceae bacterium]
MIRTLMMAALLTLAACNDGGVMREIERAEKARADAVEDPVTLPSGVIVQFHSRGPDQTLPRPSGRAGVLVHYEASLASDGTVVDSSLRRGQPAEFGLADMIGGFREAVMQMRPGDEIIATLPPELAYGAAGNPPAIPPNATMRFRIQLIAFQEADGVVVSAQ